MKKKHTDSHYYQYNNKRSFSAQFSYHVKQKNSHLRPISDHRHPCFDCPCDPVSLLSTLVWVCWALRSLLAGVPYFRPYNQTTNSQHCEGKVGLQYRPVKSERTIDVKKKWIIIIILYWTDCKRPVVEPVIVLVFEKICIAIGVMQNSINVIRYTIPVADRLRVRALYRWLLHRVEFPELWAYN